MRPAPDNGAISRVLMRYNSAGLRSRYTISKGGTTSPDERFTYRGDALAQAAVVSGTASYTDTYLYDPTGQPLELLRQQNGTTSRFWYEEDGRGNVVALTDTSGNVVDRYGYDAWGAPIAAQTSETVAQPFRYAGYWRDAALGWYWVRVRPYDPALKRWLQPDPSEQDGVHTYVYANDDPVDVTDSTGNGGISICGLVISLVCWWAAAPAMETADQTFVQVFVLSDIETLTSSRANLPEKILVIASWLPAGRVLKVFKLVKDAWRVAKVGIKDRRLIWASLEALEKGSAGARHLRQSLIDRAIERALASSVKGTQREGEVARYLRQAGIDVIRFQRKFGHNGEIGEIDVETPEAIIEVATGEKDKLGPVVSKQSSKVMNPSGKPVILYAPRYLPSAAEHIWNAGGIVVRDVESLQAALDFIKKGIEPGMVH